MARVPRKRPVIQPMGETSLVISVYGFDSDIQLHEFVERAQALYRKAAFTNRAEFEKKCPEELPLIVVAPSIAQEPNGLNPNQSRAVNIHVDSQALYIAVMGTLHAV